MMIKRSALWMVLCWTAAAPASAFWSLGGDGDHGIEDGVVHDEDSQPKQEHHSPTVDDPVEYGVDVSFPMHYDKVSDNYPWLPHNTDPENVKTPRRYKDKVIQPLGDRQAFYDDFLESCVEHFGYKGERCRQNERERVAMSLRQPQSMTVSEAQERGTETESVCACWSIGTCNHAFVVIVVVVVVVLIESITNANQYE